MANYEANSPADQLIQEQYDEKKLKHLEFVQVAALYVLVCCSTLYGYAKENSGPLKPGVLTVEWTVQSVIGPLFEKFRDVPLQFLQFADRKVDDALSDLDLYVPAFVKQVWSRALSAAPEAPEVARDLASKVQRSGLVDTAWNVAKNAYVNYRPAAEELYAKYEPVAEKYAVAAWYRLNRLPLFPQAARVLVPTAAYWAEKYNEAVVYAAEKGYTASSYFPLVPFEKIAKTFESV